VIFKNRNSLGEILTTSFTFAVMFCGEKFNPRSPTAIEIVSQFIQFTKCISIINNHIKEDLILLKLQIYFFKREVRTKGKK
jgi:hypothetical protein